ncbi:MAG: TonB-dependent receptor [Bacteroidales bacterium]
MSKRFYIILVVVSLLLWTGVNTFSSKIYGQDSMDYIALSLEDTTLINSATITAERFIPKIIPVQILTGEALHKLSVHSVADAVRYFSGVQIKDYGGIGGLKTVNIRSLGTQHVGVFYDGIELGNAQNGTIDLGKFSLDNMEAISVYNGQKSSIFQSAKDYASAGSIYMQTRIPHFQGGEKNKFKISLKTGSFGTINPSWLWESKINKHISSSLSTEYLYTNGRYKFSYKKRNGYDTTEVRKNGNVSAFRAEAALFGTIKTGGWRSKIYYYNSKRGYPGASIREEPGKFKHQDSQWDQNFFIQSSFNNTFNKWYSLKVNAKYAYDYLHYLSDPRLDVTTMYINNHYIQQELYASLVNQFTISPWWSVNMATDFMYNILDADMCDFVFPVRYTSLTALANSFNFGKLKFQTSILYTHVHEETKVIGADVAPEKNKWTPTVLGSYKPLNNIDLSFRAFYKKIFRMPTLNDLYYTFIGNIQLNPEYTEQYDLGFVYEKEMNSWYKYLRIQVDGYYNRVKNKIIAMPTSNQFRWTMMNLGYVEIKGLDVAWQQRFEFDQVGIDLRLNYTYQTAQDLTDPSDMYYGGQAPYIPWHSGSMIINGNWKNWDMNYSFIYTGERYESQANIPENYAQPWYTSDISFSREIEFYQNRQTTLRVSLEINNILNQQYEVVKCYPMPGINFRIVLDYIF